MIKCFDMREYFASGTFEEDISFNIAQADLLDASNSMQRYEKRQNNKSNAERIKREQWLYKAAKNFVTAYDIVQKHYTENVDD